MTSSKKNQDPIFDCLRCGDCCRGYGGTYVTPNDIGRIAAHIGEDPNSFQDRYCQMSGRRPVLAQAENGYCIFLKELCSIHPVKPRMCRRWPFIDAVLEDVQNWRMMAASCPGMRTDLPDAVIREHVARAIADEDEEQ
ncbi:MAG: YkgJ family cysteine cluster protein [Desulfobacterales bacterium]|nr:YkgJ family cysteine cluster protein [Desulfobacterales bacterium]